MSTPRMSMDDPAFRSYYDASHFRTDTWNDLKILTGRRERSFYESGDPGNLDDEITRLLDRLDTIEQYWAFPGRRICRHLRGLLTRGFYRSLARQTERAARFLFGDVYRHRDVGESFGEDADTGDYVAGDVADATSRARGRRPYFEVLLVDEMAWDEGGEVRRRMLGLRQEEDDFIYDVVLAGTLEDAIIAALFNHNIQSVVIRYNFPFDSPVRIANLRHYLTEVDLDALRAESRSSSAHALSRALASIRPELDQFLVTDDPVRNVSSQLHNFRRVFYHQEDYLELHLSILQGIDERHETPFFTALREYSQKPTGVFHALPISRGKSLTKSHWIRDMADFYGTNIFLAETSSTSGGLDSLLQPQGPIKRSQEKAARAFGAKETYLVTNGTSTANKIVLQALLRPGDIVLVSRDCHKSHHYAMMLAGALPVYLDPYPLPDFSFYGAVPLAEIKRNLLRLRDAGKLDRVRMLLLTNITFDGIVYNPARVMREVLAIKPDIVFVWDEAWFAFGRFSPMYRRRSAMENAARLAAELRSGEYRASYNNWSAAFNANESGNDDDKWLDGPLMPDPDRARVRVYATQSTHKTLTSLRQGSMIHVWDQDFNRLTHDAFEEAYMTHTSTSPNYQILASLDVGRRQVELEGYELVQESVALAMALRERVEEHPLLSRYFRVLKSRELIPAEFRPSGFEQFYNPESGYASLTRSWKEDEFVLDPTRVTLQISATGLDGDTMRKRLQNEFDIQINKTSRNTLLFMLNIGTTRGAIAYLLEVLTRIARRLEDERESQSEIERRLDDERIEDLSHRQPPLPNFSRFHPRFGPDGQDTPEGNLREAFFLSYDADACEFLPMDGTVAREIDSGREIVSATFVTPYPPGFPVLVPGQVLSEGILTYLKQLDVKEIHGYDPRLGLRVFKDAVLNPAPGWNSRQAAAGVERQ